MSIEKLLKGKEFSGTFIADLIFYLKGDLEEGEEFSDELLMQLLGNPAYIMEYLDMCIDEINDGESKVFSEHGKNSDNFDNMSGLDKQRLLHFRMVRGVCESLEDPIYYPGGDSQIDESFLQYAVRLIKDGSFSDVIMPLAENEVVIGKMNNYESALQAIWTEMQEHVGDFQKKFDSKTKIIEEQLGIKEGEPTIINTQNTNQETEDLILSLNDWQVEIDKMLAWVSMAKFLMRHNIVERLYQEDIDPERIETRSNFKIVINNNPKEEGEIIIVGEEDGRGAFFQTILNSIGEWSIQQ